MRRQRIKVLVVDHDLLFLRLLTCYLQLQRYEVCAACSGEQVIEQVEVYAPDLVLLDVDAGHPAALTICRRIRERSQAPIICISAVRTEEKRGLFDLGADEYLSDQKQQGLRSRLSSHMPELNGCLCFSCYLFVISLRRKSQGSIS